MARGVKFDWDEANTGHIARHGVTPQEVEQASANDPLVVLAVQRRSGEERVLCAGLAGGGRIHIITAHTAKRNVKERL